MSMTLPSLPQGRLVGIVKKKDLLEHIDYHRALRRRVGDDDDDS
jgi:hypothetical protein